jgi:carbonic anhydrase
MNKHLIHALLLAQAEAAEGDKWNYIKHGADWGTGCTDGSTNQTPIDLFTENTDGWNAYPKIEGVNDPQNYYDQESVKVNYLGYTSQVNLQEDQTKHGFSSNIPKEYFGADTEIQFNAKQFHFHNPSEHSYNGKLFDLEMHTVHLEE